MRAALEGKGEEGTTVNGEGAKAFQQPDGRGSLQNDSELRKSTQSAESTPEGT